MPTSNEAIGLVALAASPLAALVTYLGLRLKVRAAAPTAGATAAKIMEEAEAIGLTSILTALRSGNEEQDRLRAQLATLQETLAQQAVLEQERQGARHDHDQRLTGTLLSQQMQITQQARTLNEMQRRHTADIEQLRQEYQGQIDTLTAEVDRLRGDNAALLARLAAADPRAGG